MRKLLFLLFMLVFFLQANSQNIQLTQVTASSIIGGLNINVRVASGNGAGFIGYTYTVQGNIINLDFAIGLTTLYQFYFLIMIVL